MICWRWLHEVFCSLCQQPPGQNKARLQDRWSQCQLSATQLSLLLFTKQSWELSALLKSFHDLRQSTVSEHQHEHDGYGPDQLWVCFRRGSLVRKRYLCNWGGYKSFLQHWAAPWVLPSTLRLEQAAIECWVLLLPQLRQLLKYTANFAQRCWAKWHSDSCKLW